MVTVNSTDQSLDLRYVLGRSAAERIRFMDKAQILKYPAASDLENELVRLLNMEKRPRMGNLLIIGESNNGKTTLVRKFYEQHGQPRKKDDEAEKPVVVVEAPPTPDEKSLYLSILDRFHAPHRNTAPATQLRYQALHMLRECRVHMLIIDEFHSLLAGTGRKQLEVMNTIKFMCNELQIPIVGVGTEVAVNVLRTDPQHASRFRVALLPRWEWGTDFRKLVRGFAATLPLRQPSNLDEHESLTLLLTFSMGKIGNLREGLVRCATEAIRTKSETITPELIRKMKGAFRPSAGIPVPARGLDDGPSG